jgi:hypothetical protein
MKEKRKKMKFKEMLEIVGDLAKSQGSYSRMFENLKEMEKDKEKQRYINDWLEEKNVKDVVDLILALEGN